MPTPHEKTPQQKLGAMLDDFQQANQTATTDPGRELRELVEKTPELKASFLKQIEQRHLDGFLPLNRPGLSGAYVPDTKKMEVSLDQLNDTANSDPVTKRKAANSLRFTLAHEIDHARTHDVSMAEKKQFYKNVEHIASSPNTPPHDYTNLVKTFNDQQRAHEVRAEIAGFNTLADYVRKQDPHATLGDLYWASQKDMQHYIDFDKAKPNNQYTLKPGLTLDSHLKIPTTPENIKTMGQLFYEARDYPEENVNRALGKIEMDELTKNPEHPAPPFHVNLKEIGAPGAHLPSTARDISAAHRLEPSAAAPAPEPAVPMPAASTPVAAAPAQAMSDGDRFMERLSKAVALDDPDAFMKELRAATEEYNRTPAGQVLVREMERLEQEYRQEYKPLAEARADRLMQEVEAAHARPYDPRHPEHPDHRMYQNVSDRVSVCYAERGVALGHEQFENAVAGVMSAARARGMTDVHDMRFAYNPETKQTDFDRIYVAQKNSANPNLDSIRMTTTADMNQAQQTPAAASYQTFAQDTQRIQTEALEREQQRQMEMQRGRGMSL